jgi:hypothetical protein
MRFAGGRWCSFLKVKLNISKTTPIRPTEPLAGWPLLKKAGKVRAIIFCQVMLFIIAKVAMSRNFSS